MILIYFHCLACLSLLHVYDCMMNSCMVTKNMLEAKIIFPMNLGIDMQSKHVRRRPRKQTDARWCMFYTWELNEHGGEFDEESQMMMLNIVEIWHHPKSMKLTRLIWIRLSFFKWIQGLRAILLIIFVASYTCWQWSKGFNVMAQQ